MKHKYHVKQQKASYVMEISCAQCKSPVLLYQKRGPGGLLKIHPDRIIEAEVEMGKLPSALLCPECQFDLALCTTLDGKTIYRVLRGHVNTKKLRAYRYH